MNGLGDDTLTADFSINLMRDFDLGRGNTISVALPKDRLQVFLAEETGARP